jgi:hypothetical protein
VNIEAKDVSIFPKHGTTKFNCFTSSVCGEYCIWNSWGKAKYSLEPELKN